MTFINVFASPTPRIYAFRAVIISSLVCISIQLFIYKKERPDFELHPHNFVLWGLIILHHIMYIMMHNLIVRLRRVFKVYAIFDLGLLIAELSCEC
jgi:hypothetical protein